MSSASSPAPKTMSSRLLTMKFMQRAASSPISPPNAASDEPSPKRRRTDSNKTPTKFNVDSLADQRAIQAAMAAEEDKRQTALDKQAAEAGDTRWVLSFDDQKQASVASGLSLRVIPTAFASLDSPASRVQFTDEDLERKTAIVGRRSFGRFNKSLEKQQDPSFEDSSESDSEAGKETSDDESDSDDPTNQLIKSSKLEALQRMKTDHKAKKQAEKATSKKLAKERKKKEVSLNGLTSLSGRQDLKCFKCGGPHVQSDCPQKRRYQGGDEGPARKSRRAI